MQDTFLHFEDLQNNRQSDKLYNKNGGSSPKKRKIINDHLTDLNYHSYLNDNNINNINNNINNINNNNNNININNDNKSNKIPKISERRKNDNINNNGNLNSNYFNIKNENENDNREEQVNHFYQILLSELYLGVKVIFIIYF